MPNHRSSKEKKSNMNPLPRVVLMDDADTSQYIDPLEDFVNESEVAPSSHDIEPAITMSSGLLNARDSLELIRCDNYMENKLTRKWKKKMKQLREEDRRLWRKAYVAYVEWRCRRSCRKLAEREDW